MPVRRIWSGGQTGVDRAALDAALELGIPIGGWCPRGGWAEDGIDLLRRYPQLRETPSEDPAQRTRWNVRDSDAMLVVTRTDARSPGMDLALQTARTLDRPYAVVLVDEEQAVDDLDLFLQGLEGKVLSVGGPRESQAPGIYREARTLLESVLR